MITGTVRVAAADDPTSFVDVPVTAASPAWVPGPSAALYPPEVLAGPPLAENDLPDVPLVNWTDLYHAGDTAAQTLNRMIGKTPSLVVLPDGDFTLPANFNMNDTSSLQLCQVNGGTYLPILGLAGQSVTGTRISQPLLSSPDKTSVTSGTTPFRLMKYSDSTNNPTTKPVMYFGRFTLNGNEQGNEPNGGLMFHGLTVYHPKAAQVLIADIKVTGWLGRGGNPPFENFGVEVDAIPGMGTKIRYMRIEADGRRPDGKAYGTVGMTVQDADDFIAWECNSHHTVASSIVGFRSKKLIYVKCNFGQSGGPYPFGSVQPTGFGWKNSELVDVETHYDCTYAGSAMHQTFSHSNPAAKLTMVNPSMTPSTVTPTKNLHIQAWVGTSQNYVQLAAPPTIVDPAGAPAKNWDFRNGNNVTASN